MEFQCSNRTITNDQRTEINNRLRDGVEKIPQWEMRIRVRSTMETFSHICWTVREEHAYIFNNDILRGLHNSFIKIVLFFKF